MSHKLVISICFIIIRLKETHTKGLINVIIIFVLIPRINLSNKYTFVYCRIAKTRKVIGAFWDLAMGWMLRSIAKKNRFIWNRYSGGHQKDWERTLHVMWTESQLGILNTQCTRVKVFHTGDKRSAKLLFSSSFICAYGAARSYNLYDGRNCVIPYFSVNSLLNVLFYYKFQLLQAHAQSPFIYI